MRWLAAVVLLVGAPAGADDDPAPLAITARLDGTVVRMTARFAFDVEPGVSLNLQQIALPPGAVVTSGAASSRGVRHPLRLENADVVSHAFDALVYKQPSKERIAAVSIAGGPSNVSIDTLSPIETKLGVELALEVPTCFFHDARYVLVPESWRARLGATTTRPSALDVACGESDEKLRWIRFATPHVDERIGAVTGRLALPAAHLARVEVDLASRLSDVPGDLYTAIVIDHSRSMSATELDQQRAVVAAYLAGAPTSRVQVIAYARRAQPLLPAWMIASQAAPGIDRAVRALAQRNGSNLDLALAEAASWLARAKGTKRIVVISDERLSERLGEQPAVALRRAVPAATLVHVVVPSTGEGRPERSDENALAALAQTTEGISVFAGVDDHGFVDATMLLRPTSLDKIVIKAAGWDTFDGTCNELAKLGEGTSCTWWGKGAAVSGPVIIEGLLWNHRFVRIVRPDPSQARTLARMLTGGSADEVLQSQIDHAAMAVNAVWSLFGTWGGQGGYEDLAGLGRSGVGHLSGRGGSSDGGVGTLGVARKLDLRPQLAAALAHCRPIEITVNVELTLEEIVDVTVDTADPELRACATEALWDATLRIDNPPSHARVVEKF